MRLWEVLPTQQFSGKKFKLFSKFGQSPESQAEWSISRVNTRACCLDKGDEVPPVNLVKLIQIGVYIPGPCPSDKKTCFPTHCHCRTSVLSPYMPHSSRSLPEIGRAIGGGG
ncbi:hypothetical protein ElyMa_004886500 [Elysia marginata]|uniref:Uncharacterized protein n=1 Tax=Elysia marginata TaxID=1093978 RepID=A0AAV4IUZ9_9GAST|nr:hypothetical protein ElyMa_004886500 [Elysia marginata]